MKLKILFVLSFLLVITRIPLFNPHGQYFFGDEIRYKRLIITLEQGKRTNDPLLYWQGVFAIHARPLFAVLYSPAIWLEAQSPDIPYGAILNILVNSSMVLLIYLIIERLLGIRVALTAIIVLIFSITSVIYMRHMLPYDLSLTILLLGLYIFLRTQNAFLFGFLAALSFLAYPSYTYYLVPLPFIVLYCAKFKIKPVVVFGIGCVIPILAAEFFSLLVGAESYISSVQYLNTWVTELAQGDFMPASSFFIEYILGNDGLWGLILICSAPLLIFFVKKRGFMVLLAYILSVFLMLELFSHIIPKTVLYGRTVRPFYFLLLISATIVFDRFFSKLSKKFHLPYILFYGLFVMVMIVNWWPRFNTLKSIVYPATVQEEAELYLAANYKKYVLEDVYTKKRSEEDNQTDPPRLEFNKFYLVDPTFLYPYYGNLDAPCTKDVLFEREHTVRFLPYEFEGYTRVMREYLAKDPPKYQLIYCKDVI